MKNGITINGRTYELVETDDFDEDECKGCALLELCDPKKSNLMVDANMSPCKYLSAMDTDNVKYIGFHFKERKCET